jgi:hypothetical protein
MRSSIFKFNKIGILFAGYRMTKLPRLLVKIHIVILSEAKNLLLFFSNQKSKEEILRTYVLRMTKKLNL